MADKNQVGKMWEQSGALMKRQSEQNAWIKYIETCAAG
ncbi:hypothetical protein LT85_2528 [Collimonas arenae]|uniref:Uncharacterized protein n=1 Tax=Collimonas arenae TaxID=279058 RepID=A0A0A1FAZ1_9BURK|nr:hypothetical protein LT85_2528 [Collimonas arenae]